MADPAIKIAVAVADPEKLPGWILRLIEGIHQRSELELCAVIAVAPPENRERPGWLYRLVYRIEVALVARRPPVSQSAINAAIRDFPRIDSTDEAAIQNLEADVVLDLSGNHGQCFSHGMARLGIWFTDVTTAVPGVAGMIPLLERLPVCLITLCRRTSSNPMPSAISVAAVNPKFIAARNAWFLEEKSVALILRELCRCKFDPEPGHADALPSFVSQSAPSTSDVMRYTIGMMGKIIGAVAEHLARIMHLRPGMFRLRVIEGIIETFDPAQAEIIASDDNSYFADPFLWQKNGETWCFFERYDYGKRIGTICAGRLVGGQLVDVVTVLSPGYHLSFPFLFEHDGLLFMMPEACAKKWVEVWRCCNFPDQWELHATALEGRVIADCMMATIDDDLWLFANEASDPFGDVSSELHLYRVSGPDLLKLEPHPFNPVVFDSRYARNAGRIHHSNGKVLRPAQNNSRGLYGYGINIRRIDEISMQEFRESTVRQIEPGYARGLIGCHHVDSAGGQLVFDERTRIGGFA